MKNRGITLIALVITSVIILVLAAVAVSAITGQDGLFSKTNNAGTLFNESSKNEKQTIDLLINSGYFGEMNKIDLSEEMANIIKNKTTEIELRDILTSKIMCEKIFDNDDAIKYILKDKECLDIIKGNSEILNLFSAKSNLTLEQINEINVNIFNDKNKIQTLLNYGKIEKLGIDEFIDSNTLLAKTLNNTEVVNYMLDQENGIYHRILDSETSIKVLENSNVAMAKILEDQELLDKYNESDNKTIYLEQYSGAYTGNVQAFVAKESGKYLIQCWGARGGASLGDGSRINRYGKGGYAKGEIQLEKYEILYVYVGGHGGDGALRKDSPGGWNGGGLGTWDHSDNETAGGGGGATDIRLVSGNPSDQRSLASRIMVAGGGGGGSWNYYAGAGGGVAGITKYSVSAPGTQTSGYAFGIGKDGSGTGESDGVAGGGGGYYGGNTSNVSYKSSGAGGSGYISGHENCIAIVSETDITPKVAEYTVIEDSYHYSGKIFLNTVLLDGAQVQPTFDNSSTMTGNDSDGYCLITLIE